MWVRRLGKHIAYIAMFDVGTAYTVELMVFDLGSWSRSDVSFSRSHNSRFSQPRLVFIVSSAELHVRLILMPLMPVTAEVIDRVFLHWSCFVFSSHVIAIAFCDLRGLTAAAVSRAALWRCLISFVTSKVF